MRDSEKQKHCQTWGEYCCATKSKRYFSAVCLSFERVAILVAIAVNEDGYREVLGAAEGMKEDKASWVRSFQWPRGRSLDGVNR